MYDKKTIAGTKTLTFYYPKTQLFNNVKLYTTYRAKMIRDKDGTSQIDNYAMTDDEVDAFEIFAKEAIINLFQLVLKMANGIDDAVTIKGTYTDSSSVAHLEVYAVTINDEEAFNENNLYTAEDGIKQFLHASIMSAWYSLVGLTDLQGEWLLKIADIRRDIITNRFFGLRKVKLS